MSTFQFRAVQTDGSIAAGWLDAADRTQAIAQLRGKGSAPLELAEVRAAPRTKRVKALSGKTRTIANTAVAELAVLLKAGLQLDRALSLTIQNIEDEAVIAELGEILAVVREGQPLSRAMAEKPALFSATAVAMAEAGEANGRLGESLTRLAAMQEQAAELRRLIGTSMIYPAALLVIAVAVILLMLLFVVPQFETLFATTTVELPFASRMVMGASQFVRARGLWLLAGAIAGMIGLRAALRAPRARRSLDLMALRMPQLGALIRRIEAARFAHTMGALVEGGVPLPTALVIARRTVGNGIVAERLDEIATRVKEGGGLTAGLLAADIFPRLAIGFVRVGEETSQLGLMMSRLAEVLDRDVKVRLQRLIAILTPAITVVLGATVGGIIAAIMSAILGFNDLAVAQ